MLFSFTVTFPKEMPSHIISEKKVRKNIYECHLLLYETLFMSVVCLDG